MLASAMRTMVRKRGLEPVLMNGVPETEIFESSDWSDVMITSQFMLDSGNVG
jgi:hypothetical protein